MSTEQIREGDLVKLKSGGPMMTVTGTREGGYLLCEWFDDKGTAQFATFQPHALRKVSEDDNTPFIAVG